MTCQLTTFTIRSMAGVNLQKSSASHSLTTAEFIIHARGPGMVLMKT